MNGRLFEVADNYLIHDIKLRQYTITIIILLTDGIEQMNAQEHKSEVSKMVKIESRDLMGTKAYHQLGDISRDEYDLFYATGETEKYWVGMWIEGFGYFNVLFPKETSRELTKDEIEKYNNTYVQINSQPPIKLEVS